MFRGELLVSGSPIDGDDVNENSVTSIMNYAYIPAAIASHSSTNSHVINSYFPWVARGGFSRPIAMHDWKGPRVNLPKVRRIRARKKNRNLIMVNALDELPIAVGNLYTPEDVFFSFLKPSSFINSYKFHVFILG